MLRFDKNVAVNTHAAYLETVDTTSGYYEYLGIFYSQSYDNSTGNFRVYPVSIPNQYRHWITFNTSGSDITFNEVKSGQYEVELWKTSEPIEGRWAFVAERWDTYDQTWATAGEGGLPQELLYTDRAYIVGSNESSITEYVSPDENGTYTTYNG